LKISYVGRSRVFSLNQENILYQPLRELFQAEDQLVPQLESIIKNSIKKDPKLRESLVNASIYGSILTSEARPDSDVDLFLLFKSKSDEKITEEHFSELEVKIGKLFGNRLHLFTTNIDDLNALKRSNKAIFHSLKSAHLIYGKELKELIRQNAEDTENH
jgi:predicted nucleotidyltransferase